MIVCIKKGDNNMEEQFMFKGIIGKLHYSVYLEDKEEEKTFISVDIGEESCNQILNKDTFTIEIPVLKLKDCIEVLIKKELNATNQRYSGQTDS